MILNLRRLCRRMRSADLPTGLSRGPWFCTFAVLFATHIGLFSVSSVFAEETVSLETIRAAIREHVTSITSISTKYRVYSTPVKGDPYPHSIKEPWGPQEREWAEQGSQKLLRYGPVDLRETEIFPFWRSYDGRTGYSVNYGREDMTRIVSIIEDPEIDTLYKQLETPAEFSGLRMHGSDQSLLELLAKPEAKADGAEQIGGNRCWRVDLGDFRAFGGQIVHLAVAFDPAHGFLPRRITFRVSEKDANFGKPGIGGGWQGEFQTVDFQTVHDPLLGREHWFPHEGRFLNYASDLRFVIDEVVINATLPVERFRPQPQPGTEIYLGPVKQGEPANSYIFGGPEAVDAVMNERLEQATLLAHESSSRANLLDARDTHKFFSASLIFWISIGIITAIGSWKLAQRIWSR